MIKNIFSSKLTSTASAEFAIIGLKLVDAEAHPLRFAGMILAATSFSLLIVALVMHSKHDAVAKKVNAKRNRRSSRSRASRTI